MASRQDQHPVVLEPEPWLVFCHGKDIAGQTFCNISEDCYYVMNIHDMLRKDICTCSHGWMVILDTIYGQCFLLNPFTLEKFNLPHRDWKSFKYDECLLSSPPNDPNCTVLFTHDDEFKVSICRLRDNEWIVFVLFQETANFSGSVSCNGDIYTLAYNGAALLKINTQLDDVGMDILFVRTPCVQSDSIGADIVGLPDWGLVGSNNELFYFHKYDLTRTNSSSRSRMLWSFQIFKIDFSTMEWERVRNLENKALFFDSNGYGTLCYTTAGSRILSNSVYFTEEGDSYLFRFDIREKTISATLPCPYIPQDLANSVWVMPDIKAQMKIMEKMMIRNVIDEDEYEYEDEDEDEDENEYEFFIFMKMKMKMQIDAGTEETSPQKKEILEETKKEELRISFKVVRKSPFVPLTIEALPRLLLAFVKDYKMMLFMLVMAIYHSTIFDVRLR